MLAMHASTALPADGSRRQNPDSGRQQCGPLLLSVSIDDAQVLQHCYLPFLRNGGLFVPGVGSYQLRQRLCLILKLPAPATGIGRPTYALMVTVAWLAAPEAQGSKGMGVGLHFDRGGEAGGNVSGGERAEADVKMFIESLLSALL